jgi:toxin HigB-1
MGNGVHKLSGDLNDFWAIKITPNYRIIFRFEAGEVLDVDYLDYH